MLDMRLFTASDEELREIGRLLYHEDDEPVRSSMLSVMAGLRKLARLLGYEPPKPPLIPEEHSDLVSHPIYLMSRAIFYGTQQGKGAYERMLMMDRERQNPNDMPSRKLYWSNVKKPEDL